jgi:hypothetical protein
MAIDFEAEGLLQGLEGEARDARVALLEGLAQRGVPLEELKQAVAESRLALLPIEHALSGEGPRYSAEEVADRVGLDLGVVTRVWRAIGLSEAPPDERVYTDEDIEAATRARAFLDAGLPEEGIIQVARVIGMTMAQLAAANRELIASSLRRPGDTELDVALRYAGAARQFTPMLGPMLAHAHNLHLREQIGHDVVALAELGAGSAGDLGGVCVLRRHGRLHQAGRAGADRGDRVGRNPPHGAGKRGRGAAGAAGEADWGCGDAGLVGATRAGRRGAGADRGGGAGRGRSSRRCAPGSPSAQRSGAAATGTGIR